MLEKEIEARLVKAVEKAGGLCFKFTSPHNPGVPDRIVLLPGGRVVFVELKAAWGRMSNIQKWQRDRIEALGVDIRVLKGMEQVKAFLKEIAA